MTETALREQDGILADVPQIARFLTFRSMDSTKGREAVARLPVASNLVFGLGPSLLEAFGCGGRISPFVPMVSGEIVIPSTQADLWIQLRGADAAEVLLEARRISGLLSSGFQLVEDVPAFRYREGRDLTGYVDGTENPTGARAREVALRGDGASVVLVQRWVHELESFAALGRAACDDIIGRARSTNEELESAPAFAHVKKTAQERIDAWMVRRSMPYGDVREQGLMFVAYAADETSFETSLRSMLGLGEDSVVDGLFRFSRPVTSAKYLCPPVRDGRLDLRP